MTQKEFLKAVVGGQVTDDMVAYAQDALTKLDAKIAKNAENRAKKASAKEMEKAPIREALMACLTISPKTASTLIEEAGVDAKPQTVASLFKDAIATGAIIKTDVKVMGKGKQVGYSLGE